MEQESTIVVINEVDSLVQQSLESIVVLVDGSNTTVQQQDSTAVVQQNPETTVLTGHIQGISGPPGQDYTYINILAQENINGHRAINIHGYMSNQPFLGISTQSSIQGLSLQVQQTGYLTHQGWQWVVGEPIFADDTGTLTQVPPISGLQVIVGYQVTPTKIFIKQEPAILLG